MKKTLIKILPKYLYLYLRWYDFKFNRAKGFKKVQEARKVDSPENGGYLPFDKAQAIFVHIPKCAGISLNKALFNSIGGGHTTLEQYINVFPPRLFCKYFKFTFVRNPWDRVASAYFFLQTGGMNPWDKEFYEQELAQYASFEDFVLNWLKPENLFKHHHFTPQYHYLFDQYKKVSVDYVGYVESIDEDFAYISKRMGVNASLAKNNAVHRADYRNLYSPEMIEKVREVYQQDIELLNYDFNGVIEPVRNLSHLLN